MVLEQAAHTTIYPLMCEWTMTNRRAPTTEFCGRTFEEKAQAAAAAPDWEDQITALVLEACDMAQARQRQREVERFRSRRDALLKKRERARVREAYQPKQVSITQLERLREHFRGN